MRLGEVEVKKLMGKIEGGLEKGDVEGGKRMWGKSGGGVGCMWYEGLMRMEEGLEVVEG